ncbi:hypothetical protein [Ruania alba]|uniref:Uncharacterized protein n=1 Tax=Ruania alba TaxID=648782 RepID=A0A1H5HK52_9MICO|nr:hypothetical protein [Ruania alba]SEE27638.1 hypothetical protein SAMN04488554_1967 [Ruania alba]
MTEPLHVPPSVRCNRGVGWSFWLVMGITALVTLVAIVGTYDRAPGGATFGLPGVGIGVLIILVRAVGLPRLEIRTAERSLRTRRRTIPFSAVSRISFTKHIKAGTWADFIGHEGDTLGRMSIAGSLCAAPTAEQWTALEHMIASTVHGANPTDRPSAPGRPLSPAAAISIVQAQAAWCRAGHRSDARRAPAAALLGTTVSLR